ncbi:hypothetical protein SEA_SANDALPHON_68 [Mycobacterium phage Sandalphon]|uniref:Uncharacterized protein n=4 Tax=Caudoviricetes TaxID=2731619 RepID=A0A142K851_9CAUD|nr:hypothetical protein BJD68_gp58 [Mycobacterium phage Phrann]YP_009958203.1 hypothetical protein I5H48_gp068 [Mycobacterium phage Hlubikazi]YP_009959943.1 hypothetical protein I5H65_gp070 [Mycobacterium phage Minnie]YP_009962108.1 hypothetical protein I5H86_gp068 [Mycobacterium phage Sandalphon]OKH68057.1 hypothetical protein EB74_34125 [Mycobacterium sp. SWH-M5]QGJ91151.1 hypothetical protein PBI_STROKESEAT_68 [Mycobacterium phage Strokeseat]QNN99068.1 hypothetical protein PBI_MANDLOVU_68 
MVSPASPLPAQRVEVTAVTGICICTHYRTEHDEHGNCLASDLFGEPCDCPGYEPDEEEDDET